MSIVTINPESSPAGALLHVDVDVGRGTEAILASRAATPAQVEPSSVAAGWLASAAQSAAPFYKVLPANIPAVDADRFAPAARGYAPGLALVETASRATPTAVASAAKAKASSTSKSSTKKTTAKKTTSSTTSASRELAFLDDKHLSIEEKLFQFMALMTKKNDQELVNAMKQYEAKKTAASQSSSTASKTSSASASKLSSSPENGGSSSEQKSLLSPDGGGGLFGFLGDALGGIGEAIVGGAETLAKDLGGPALASVATAVGMPFLAPVALKIGGDLGAGLVDGLASMAGLSAKPASRSSSSAAKSGSTSSGTKSSTKSSGASSTTAAADAEEFDEKLEMLKLQRLVEKQNAMFSALTNAMKAMHDMQMTAVQNIR